MKSHVNTQNFKTVEVLQLLVFPGKKQTMGNTFSRGLKPSKMPKITLVKNYFSCSDL